MTSISNNLRANATVRFVSTAAAMGALLQLLLTGCAKPAPQAHEVHPVLVSTVHLQKNRSARTYTASIRARYETDVGFRTAGKVVGRLVDIGDYVKAGQPLARLDTSDYNLAVTAARDSLKADTVEADQAASDEARFKRLLSDGSLGTAEHERQKTRADAALARLDRAKSELALAQNRLDYTTLVAPYDGVITGLKMEAGQVIAEGQPVISIAKPSELEVVADLPEQIVGDAKSAVASAQLWDRSDIKLHLKLRELSPVAFNASRTFRARFSIVGADKSTAEALHLGMTTELVLAKADSVSTAVLPASVLLKSSGAPSVWVVDSHGALKLTPVSVLEYMKEAVSVSGLSEGDKVVSAGAQKLDASMQVVPSERTVSGVDLETAQPPRRDVTTEAEAKG